MGKTVHILIGGIGTGKSTFASELSKKEGIRSISADEIQEIDEYLSDEEVDDLTDNAIENSIRHGESFIVDGKNINSRSRKWLIERCKQQGYNIYGYDFGKGNITTLIRRKKHHRQFTEEYWEDVYKSDLKSFETPEPDEGFDRIYYPPR